MSTIAAGEIRPVGTTGDETDVVTARRYRHPALDDRPVVRLIPRTLAPAEDLTAEYLGFAEPERVAEVGTGRREAMGFPAWALVNDPTNAHHALNLVKAIERLARTAKSKPGHAKDGFVDLAAILDRAAPHFLPTFYEEVGRIFIEAGNLSYAGTMFGRAREAEEVHNLTVVPEHQRQVFLEFAFAGAVTAKTLSKHAKTLAAHWTPQQAYDEFTSLCVERIKGGLPPYTGMPEDIRRLAKAAGLNLPMADKALLRAMLGSLTISRATTGFWKSYRKSLVSLAAEDPEVRGRLLAIVPNSWEAHDVWIGILTESGTSAALTEPAATVSPQEQAPGSPAAWLSRFVASRGARWSTPDRSAILLDLVSAMTERLRADGNPVDLLVDDHIDLDLLDLCLAERVPLRERTAEPVFTVRKWLNDNSPGRRDLTAIAADSTLLPALGKDLASTYLLWGDTSKALPPAALAPVLSTPGLRAALSHWLEATAEKVHNGSLVTMRRHLDRLRPVRDARAFVDTPQSVERIARTSVSRALATTLRGGIFDEFGWAALDETMGRLLEGVKTKPGEENPIEIAGEAWPALILRRQDLLVVVGPEGVLLEHVVRIPADSRNPYRDSGAVAAYVDGRLLVIWYGKEGQLAYWSDAPDAVFPAAGSTSWFWGMPPPSLAMPGGERFTGDRVLHPGDTALPGRLPAHTDGISYWRQYWNRNAIGWQEIDPATGTTGRFSLPSWIEGFAADGSEIDLGVSWLRPAVPGTDASPLGHANGMLGFRVRREADGTWLGERIDGVTGRLAPSSGDPVAALRFPGDDEPRLVTKSWPGFGIFTPAGERIGQLNSKEYRPDMARGTAFMPPRAWWPCLRVRDEAGSRALRTVTEELAHKLVDAKDPAGTLAELLPEITHPELIAGVLGIVQYAREQLGELSAYREMVPEAAAMRDSADELASVDSTIDNLTMYQALCWTRTDYQRSLGNDPITSVIATLGRLAKNAPAGSPPEVEPFGDIQFDIWSAALVKPAAIAWRAASPITPAEERIALVVFLRTLAASGMADGGWRTIEVVTPANAPARRTKTGTVIPTPDGFMAIWQARYSGRGGEWSCVGLQFSANPTSFRLPEGWRLRSDRSFDGGFGGKQIIRFCDALEANGPLQWRPELVSVLSESTGLSLGEAALLLAGLPNVTGYDTNFLQPAVREAIGLTGAVARSARGRFLGRLAARGRFLLSAAIPADPAALWTTGPNLSAIAEGWIERFDRRTPVPDDVLAEAEKQLPLDNVAEHMSGVANPEACTWLNTGEPFTSGDLDAIRNVLPWLAYHLPVGSPIRAQLPRALTLTRVRLGDPGLKYRLGSVHDLGSEKNRTSLLTLLRLSPDTEDEEIDVDGLFHLHGTGNSAYQVDLHVGAYRLEHQQTLAAVCALVDYGNDRAVETLPVLLSDELEALCSHTPADGADPSAYYQDPTVSVPDLVDLVATKYEVDADVSALYLQLLALPDPTDANVAKWTGWKPARLRTARTALAETDLVLTAKRARAGRSLFLPGAWLALKSPHLPIESWKAPLFGLGEGGPLAVITPLSTVVQLFHQAWQRIEQGDVPAYEKLVVTTGARK